MRAAGTSRGTSARRAIQVAAAATMALAALAACTVPPSMPSTSALTDVTFEAPNRIPRPSAACDRPTPTSTARQTSRFTQSGEGRFAFVDTPASTGAEPLPVILSFHPFALGAQAWDDYSDMAAEGTARGYVVVTPQGSTDLGVPRWIVRGGLPGPDDPAFIDQIIERLAAEVCIDESRIYATGFSAGAAFSATLTCVRPGLLTAIAASGGTNLALPCADAEPVDALVIHGRDDPIAPLGGQSFLPPQFLAVRTVVDSYATRGRCTGTSLVPVRPETRLVLSTGCVPGGGPAYLDVGGAGHTWAGRDDLLLAELVVGPTSFEFDATLTVLDWFDSH